MFLEVRKTATQRDWIWLNRASERVTIRCGLITVTERRVSPGCQTVCNSASLYWCFSQLCAEEALTLAVHRRPAPALRTHGGPSPFCRSAPAPLVSVCAAFVRQDFARTQWHWCEKLREVRDWHSMKGRKAERRADCAGLMPLPQVRLPSAIETFFTHRPHTWKHHFYALSLRIKDRLGKP